MNKQIDIARAQFKKSSFCGGGNCVKIAWLNNQVAVKDAKNPTRSPLIFTRTEWIAFTKGVKAGEFDPPFTRTA